MPNDNGKGIGKMVGLVALGGLIDVALEFVTAKYEDKNLVTVPGLAQPLNLNVADAVGTVAGLGMLGAGVASKKKELTLVGAGGTVVALSLLVSKLMYSNVTNTGQLSYAGPVKPQPSPYMPQANPQADLLVGSAGGGHVVYKAPNAPTYRAKEILTIG